MVGGVLEAGLVGDGVHFHAVDFADGACLDEFAGLAHDGVDAVAEGEG